MAFAGGPFNSYVLQSTGRVLELLRTGAGGLGLVTSVSGLLTKHGVGLWSSRPGPNTFSFADVTADVAPLAPARPVTDARGEVTVAGCTVVYREDGRHAVALVDTAEGGRAMVDSDDDSVIDSMEVEEWVGRKLTDGTRLTSAT
jgi:acetyl-CoA C-acetyltransferase